jgi:hypothetical protein
MGNNNWEPRIGQKVKSLITTDNLNETDVYTVAAVRKCKCGTFHVYIKDFPIVVSGIIKTSCMECGGEICGSIPAFISIRSFRLAPVQPAYENISKELANEAIKERVEVDCPVKEVVNN